MKKEGVRLIREVRQCSVALLSALVLLQQGYAQEGAASKKMSRTAASSAAGISASYQLAPHQAPAPQASTNQLPVVGGGTAGQLTKWIGFGNATNAIGDSLITETKQGNIGIGIALPNSKLSVQGMIETTLGGYKFPDGSVQTTAAISGLTSIFHDSTLTGAGNSSSPLSVSVPLNLSGGGFNAIVNISNTSPDSVALSAKGGNGTANLFDGGNAIAATGGDNTGDGFGGI